ncbi:MAG: HAD family phosphatase [Crocinitomicaceae bacterium]|nr:HAD family phosphatase [Crocinitomicaceae bacterium]
MISKDIKNIIFDLGGVLLNIDYHITINQFKDMGIQHFDELFSQAQQSHLFDNFETGKISENEFIAQLQAFFHIQKSQEEIIHAWNSMLLDFPTERKETLKKYAEQYNIVLLSNTNETHVRAFRKILQDTFGEYWFDDVFQNVYYSNEIGLRKPNKDVFEYVLDQNRFDAAETLFFDDSIQHIEGAKELGIQTIHLVDRKIEDFLSA